MKVYQVGGCVRDELLGITPEDYDYVVVGSTPEKMLELGYTQVGKDFPVFLHPETKDEYSGVDISDITIKRCPPVGEDCVYIDGKWKGYLDGWEKQGRIKKTD